MNKMRKIDRLDLISTIGRDLQSRMTYSDINVYLQGFGVNCQKTTSNVNSKWVYVKDMLASESDNIIIQIADELNLKHNYMLVNDKVVSKKIGNVEFVSPFQNSLIDTHSFIKEQTEKCDIKIASEDYYGAITNARSLLEAVFVEIEKELDPSALKYDGDLNKLYRRVQKLLNLEPSRKDISDTLKQILSGLSNVVSGLAGLRNKMSDAHVASYRPAKHHAVLAVNVAKTLANFVVATKEYQNK
jgi:hypothetical protein